jgi:deoxyribodipyrimidine photolyase
MDVAIVVFTRDLRVHDNPALATAVARARQVVPLFVVGPALAVPGIHARGGCPQPAAGSSAIPRR